VRDWLLDAFDPRPGTERGLRGWAREVYSMFADGLDLHRAALRRRKSFALTRAQTTSKKLRILILLTDGFGGIGGIAKFNRDLLTALCLDENVAEVVALPRLMPEPPGPLPDKLTYDTSGLGGKMRYVKAARNLIRREPAPQFDLIICGHVHLLPIAVLLRARLPAPCSLHLVVHGIDAWAPTASRLSNACVRRVDGFISVSNVTKRRFMRWSKLRDDQGVVLPNCVDLSAFTPGPKSAELLRRYSLHGKRILMTLGRLASEERYKGFDEVLESLPELSKTVPELAYLICGDGADRVRLAAKARALGLAVLEIGDGTNKNNSHSSGPAVVFAGKISDGEKADHFRLADVYVMPSSGEGFGIVYLEALACGVPVIGSKADGSREALLNGKLGTLVDPRDRNELLSAIAKALNEPRNGDSFAGVNGDSIERFSTGHFRRRVHDILECIAT
jgi:glycosyltransferase involved in cell wall biosynthesis